MLDLGKKCTACGACNNVCPNGSISMIEDNEGFLYPVINFNTCTKCGLCEKVCPVINKIKLKDKLEPKIYAAWTLNEELRFNSTSGGLFTEIAKIVISKGGYVVGARYNHNHLVEHAIIKDEQSISLLRQSKYVQSEIGYTFKEVKSRLENNEYVMFVGTPCECAGLLCFLNKEYEKLLVCDFICRGANSPKAYNKYLLSKKEQYNSNVKKVWFKNKINGWNKFGTKIEFDNGKEYYADRYTDTFMTGYLKYNLFIRSSCSDCKFKGFPRVSDITLADYWGIKIEDENINTDKGTSLVIINSFKGQEYFNSLAGKIYKVDGDLNLALQYNPCAVKSISMGEYRDYFFNNIDNIDFDELINDIAIKHNKRIDSLLKI